ncbi:MAG: GNAT family N-acetyltransferase [Salinivirgaceae bacterium]|nr:GNAT family N-acetyltransferase [Salinivirgaceae bacterium]
MIKPIISSIDIGDFSAIKNISNVCFGENYLTVHTLQKIITHQGIFQKISNNGHIFGFSIAVTINSMIDNKWFSSKEFKTHAEFPYGIIKTIAIHPNYQNQGLGSKLLETTVLKLEAKYDLENLLFPAWIVDDKTRLEEKLVQLGFLFTKELKQYWFKESIEANYQCAKCGNPPCTCSLGLYKKHL